MLRWESGNWEYQCEWGVQKNGPLQGLGVKICQQQHATAFILQSHALKELGHHGEIANRTSRAERIDSISEMFY